MKIFHLSLILILLLFPSVYSLSIDSDYEISEYSDLINVTDKDRIIGTLILLFPQKFERDEEYSFSLGTDLGPFIIKDVHSVDLNIRIESSTVYFSKPVEFRNAIFDMDYEINKPSKEEGWGIYSLDFKAFCKNNCSEMKISVLFPIEKYRITSYIGDVEPFWLNSDKSSSDFIFRQNRENEVRGRLYFESRFIKDKLIPSSFALFGAIFGFLLQKLIKLLRRFKTEKPKNNFNKTYLKLLTIILLFLLIAHSFSLFNIALDTNSILLLILLLILPFLPNIKKIKWGDFEAEISTEEVERMDKSFKDIKPLPKGKISGYTQKDVEDLGKYLFSLAEDDHILALAKLRMELEKVINNVHKSVIKDRKNERISLSTMIYELAEEPDLIDKRLLSNTKDVVSICNRVIHGSDINKNNAMKVIGMGVEIISYFYGVSHTLIGFNIFKK